jgi:hypothetical protein
LGPVDHEAHLRAEVPSADVVIVDQRAVSMQYVDSDGNPLDARQWIGTNAAFAGALSAYLLLSCFAWGSPDRTFGFGVRAGAGLILGAAALSRLWALLYDGRHQHEDRDFWLAHAREGRRRALIGACSVLIAVVIAMIASVTAGSTLIAGLLVGPLFGALFVLAALGDRARARQRHPHR